MALKAGLSCPEELLRGVRQGQNVFELIRLQSTLQCSSSCTVCLGWLLGEERSLCVIKSYQKYKLDDAQLCEVNQEVQLHQQLTSDCVVPFWAAVDEGAQLHIIMQYCQQSDLRSMLGSGPLSEACVRDQIVIPLLQALQELHTKGYVHRDVKPDNVFMAGSSALLGDFSLAVGPLPGSVGSLPATPGCGPCSRVSNDSTTSLTPSNSDSVPESDAAAGSADSESELGSVASLSTSRCSSMLARSYTADGGCHAGGTPAYCAPEVVLAAFNSIPMSEALGPHNDIWSLGILTAECMLGCHPYGDEAAASGAVMHSIVGGQPPLLKQLRVSAHCKDWLAAALAKDPRQRWSAERLLQHAWITADLTAEQQHDATAVVLEATVSRAPAGYADCWDEGWDVYTKQQVSGRGSQQQEQHVEKQQRHAGACAPPPWVDDDWVTGLDRLSSQVTKAGGSRGTGWMVQCRQEQELDQQQVQPQQRQLQGITSWED